MLLAGFYIWLISPLRLVLFRDQSQVQARTEKLLLWLYPITRKRFTAVEGVEAIKDRLYLIDLKQGMRAMPRVSYKTVTDSGELVQGIRRWIAVKHSEPLILGPQGSTRRAIEISLVIAIFGAPFMIMGKIMLPHIIDIVDGIGNTSHISSDDTYAITETDDISRENRPIQYDDLDAAIAAGYPHDATLPKSFNVSWIEKQPGGLWSVTGKFTRVDASDIDKMTQKVYQLWQKNGWQTSAIRSDNGVRTFGIRRHVGSAEGDAMLSLNQANSGDSTLFYTFTAPAEGE